MFDLAVTVSGHEKLGNDTRMKKAQMINATLRKTRSRILLASTRSTRAFVLGLPNRVTKRNEAAALVHMRRPMSRPRIADHLLMIYVDPGGMAALSFSDLKGYSFTVGGHVQRPTYGEGNEYYHFWFGPYDGHEVPADSMISIELAANACAEFFETRERPTCVTWTSEGD